MAVSSSTIPRHVGKAPATGRIAPTAYGGPPASAGDRHSSYLVRWLRVWIALLSVVTLVVVAYLLVITGRLASVNRNLGTANGAVVGADGNVRSLPQQVSRVNGSLGEIDTALKPIPGQADQIISSLQSIDSRLAATDGSLKNTDASLKDTSNVLRAVLGLATDVKNTLSNADNPPDRLGVQNIHQRVAFANGVGATGSFGNNPNSLTAATADTANILNGLIGVNKHLTSICRSAAVSAMGGPKPC